MKVTSEGPRGMGEELSSLRMVTSMRESSCRIRGSGKER